MNRRKTQQSNTESILTDIKTKHVPRESSTGGIIAWDHSERIKTKGPLKGRNRSDRALRTKVTPGHGKQKLRDATQSKRRSHTFIKNLLHLVLRIDSE